MSVNPRVAVALAWALRRSDEHPDRPTGARPRRREHVGPWSSASYLLLARRNAQWCRLGDVAEFLIGLLAVRADDAGRVAFARRDLVRLCGIERGDVDDAPFQCALDQLIARGWLRVEPGKGHGNTYTLALPRRHRRGTSED